MRGARVAEPGRRSNDDGSDAQARPWAVAARVRGRSGEIDVGTGLEIGGETRERRVVRVAGETVRSQTSLADYFSAVWLTPAMDRLFQDGTAARRRFLDRLVFGFDPAHAGRVSAYEHAMRERARLLKDGTADRRWLDALEESMASRGIAVAAARREMAERLDAACAAGVGPFPAASLSVGGDVEEALARDPALAVEDRLRERLAASRRADAETGGAAVGPHRGDFIVRMRDGNVPAERCSTGQQKALLISIVLANTRLLAAERGAVPVLLLDEVAAHLDGERRTALFDEILGLGAQAWMTGTEGSAFRDLGSEAQFFKVSDGVATGPETALRLN